MEKHKIEPHKITKPIQLTTIWFIALLLIDSSFLFFATKISEPKWACPTLIISAICFVPLFLVPIFLLQTVFRKELQEDLYYSEWLKRHENAFAGFKSENILDSFETKMSASLVGEDELEKIRIQKYQDYRGLFLVHSWRPSRIHGQIADIIIWIQQHCSWPLNNGDIDKVEYELGPKFFGKPITKYNSNEQYRLEVSAYGPVLCLARVFIIGENSPILLERYIDFDEAPNKALNSDG